VRSISPRETPETRRKGMLGPGPLYAQRRIACSNQEDSGNSQGKCRTNAGPRAHPVAPSLPRGPLCLSHLVDSISRPPGPQTIT
jgi:hypothetical protein